MSELVAVALDPQRSVVVEACAGSGKTWLLVSRMVRLLLDGVAPGDILAITFTRKAAREIEDRLRLWLQQLAIAPESEALAFLQERGLDAAAALAALPRARRLHEVLLDSQPGLTVNTFHGWFASLIRAAPLDSGLSGLTLAESEARLRDEAWDAFAADCARAPQSAAADGLLALLDEVGLGNTRALLDRFVARRAEWHVWLDGEGTAAALGRLADALGVDPARSAAARFAARPDCVADLTRFATLLGQRKAAGEREAGVALQAVVQAHGADAEALLAGVAPVFLTREGGLRARKPGQTVTKDLGPAGADEFLALHATLGDAVLRARQAQADEAVFAFNRHALHAGVALLEAFEQYKRQRRLMDYADLEWQADRLLSDEAAAALIQARLDARYRHILLDEFQDTNPLQWRILLAWLAAYSPDMEKPRVFMVGDPKQSIYRFRRADPRIFGAAAGFLESAHDARRLANVVTRRNAPVVVQVVNQLFGAEPRFEGFAPHLAHAAGLPGRVEALPLCDHEEDAAATAEGLAAALRDPLTEPLVTAEDRRRQREAEGVVARLRDIVGRWPVGEPGSQRAARWGDVMILCRRRAGLAEIESALRAAGIPYFGARRGGLLQTLEAADLSAVLRFLATPADDLALAHVLRTPLFGAGDAELQRLAAAEGGNWWLRLRRLVRAAGGQADASAGPAAPEALLARAQTLLADWIDAADRLPVHDLLDRIYGAGDVFMRYRAAVPTAAWPGVCANLEAYIELALQLDAGRYPSLPRFIEELERLGRAADDEAPDEGVISGGEHEDRVQLMTVHASKGLEAPVVWLADAANTHRTPDNYTALVDWPPGAERPAHFSLVSTQAARGRAREALFQAEEAAAEREELNLLYVAITRAKQYFFASGIAAGRKSTRVSPHQRIAEAIRALGGGDGAWGEVPARVAAAGAAAGMAAEPAAEPLPAGAPTPVGARRVEADNEGTAYGSLLHAILEQLTGPARQVPPRPAGVREADWQRAAAAAADIVANPALAPFFDPGRYLRAWNEASFVLADGRSGRIDRLVETVTDVWVLDYKSGEPDAALLRDYAEQLGQYRAAVAALFPAKPVRCALVLGDGRLQELA